MSYPANGATEIITTNAAEEKQQLEAALNKVLLEHYGFACSARNNLTSFLFMFDQLADQVPGVHPMELGRALYVRLDASQDGGPISDAFMLGTLFASAMRTRIPGCKPTYVDESKQDFSLPTGDTTVDNYIQSQLQREAK